MRRRRAQRPTRARWSPSMSSRPTRLHRRSTCSTSRSRRSGAGRTIRSTAGCGARPTLSTSHTPVVTGKRRITAGRGSPRNRSDGRSRTTAAGSSRPGGCGFRTPPGDRRGSTGASAPTTSAGHRPLPPAQSRFPANAGSSSLRRTWVAWIWGTRSWRSRSARRSAPRSHWCATWRRRAATSTSPGPTPPACTSATASTSRPHRYRPT